VVCRTGTITGRGLGGSYGGRSPTTGCRASVDRMSDPVLQPALDRMRADGVAEATIRTFVQQHARLVAGDLGALPEPEIEPVEDLPDVDDLPPAEGGDVRAALDATVVIKLNGGLGTSMGMTGPKALLPVADGLTFLDLIVRQVRHLRRTTGARVPLLLMHSFATRDASLAALAAHPDLPVAGVPQDVVQGRVPKLRADDRSPVRWRADPALEWAPPGHGDLYPVLHDTGLLDHLLAEGFRHAFVSNVDNLGAVVDPRILAWSAAEEVPFLMEVTDRTTADRKGGHLARRAGGGLVLREIAQTPPADVEAFQDVRRHRYFNTNSLWLDLRRLRDLLADRDGVLGLPMIVNRKTVDPTDPDSTAVIQLESAMGAAIDVIEGAQAIRVPRTRFAPVKTTDDLLALRSDAYALLDDGRLVLAAGRDRAPLVQLDPARYRLVGDLEARFPHGPPSLLAAEQLVVRGDVTFGRDVVVRGTAEVDAADTPVVADGTVLGG
jgi:UTP--glucose-1-phosphate uridylyltransferase